MDAEADRVCDAGANSREGYCERSLFPEDVIERCQRVGCALVAAMVGMYAAGASTRKAQRVAEKMGVSRLSMDQVSAIASSLNVDIEERSDDMATLLLSNYSMRCLKRALKEIWPLSFAALRLCLAFKMEYRLRCPLDGKSDSL